MYSRRLAVTECQECSDKLQIKGLVLFWLQKKKGKACKHCLQTLSISTHLSWHHKIGTVSKAAKYISNNIVLFNCKPVLRGLRPPISKTSLKY